MHDEAANGLAERLTKRRAMAGRERQEEIKGNRWRRRVRPSSLHHFVIEGTVKPGL